MDLSAVNLYGYVIEVCDHEKTGYKFIRSMDYWESINVDISLLRQARVIGFSPKGDG
jgi:hypothetical protein